MDKGKLKRDFERRLLRRAGWTAAKGLKENGAEKWVWIHPSRKRAYSRQAAVAIASRNER